MNEYKVLCDFLTEVEKIQQGLMTMDCFLKRTLNETNLLASRIRVELGELPELRMGGDGGMLSSEGKTSNSQQNVSSL